MTSRTKRHARVPLAVALLLWLALAMGVAAIARAASEDRPIERAAPAFPARVAADSQFFAEPTTNNLVEMTMTNYGFFGNNFNSTKASLVYPKGTTDAYEHMVRGGLWFGCQSTFTGTPITGVVTATTDGFQGSSGNGATEYTPQGRSILHRSILPNNKFYSPQAVSEEDMVSDFDDRVVRYAANNTEIHTPVGVSVHQESYSWAFSEYAHLIILHFTFRNRGPVMTNAWVGFYNEFASGDKSLYTSRNIWPPSSTGSIVGGWFSKKLIAYDDSLRLYREHYCANLPIPDGCNFPLAPYWIGVRLLGWRSLTEDTTTKRITLSAWSFNPSSVARDQDIERYNLMSTGVAQSLAGDSLAPSTGDPVAVLAVGPFPVIYTDSTVSVDFAIVGGADVGDIQDHSRFAQRAYDRGYIIPIPPPSPRIHTVARDGAIDVYWDHSPEFAIDKTSPVLQDFEGYRVYVGDAPLEVHRVAQFDSNVPPGDTTGFNTGFNAVRLTTPAVFEGDTFQYKYTVPALRNGFKYYVAVTAYDLGTNEVESLESGTSQNLSLTIPGPAPGERAANGQSGGVTVFPNPYRVEARWDRTKGVRDHYLWFANLPPTCTLRIFTLAGDLIFEKAFDGATYHGEGSRGIYDPKQPVTPEPPTLSGTSYGWNLITREGQAVATGLYLYTVEGGGKTQVGKILLVKSDREQ